jgi:Flp pilus assembly protein TadG
MARPSGFRDRFQARGAAAAELAMVLPLLCFMAVATVDYGRAMSVAIALEDGARNGALYLSQSRVKQALAESLPPYTSVDQVVLAAVGDLSPAPTVVPHTEVIDSERSLVTVTVSTTFTPLGWYPGLPRSVSLSRSCSMFQYKDQ